MSSDEHLQTVNAVAHFETYEAYLDSIASWQDMFYLEDQTLARAIVELGYRGTAEFMKRHEFAERRREFEASKVSRDSREDRLAADGLELEDPLLLALAEREAVNRDGRVATIIFLRSLNERNQEISGYVDYAQRLRSDAFREYFSGEARLMPRVNDLAYFNWKTQSSRCNNTVNWTVLSESVHGMVFKSRRDRKVVSVDPRTETPGDSSTRTLVQSSNYTQVVLYDHIIRQKI
ncbi:cilia- and flagella-associated protein 299-like [Pollicipes pollicipes]|uniref:cilia- and flagella-associated protein 299-like n=1 Tax=Pollicipes pollicipes TaxID=41117 RepID=UPI00188591A5|nr:cilia- and flagella-associated protein 299-like [Pollicipes pollicipes]